MVNEFDEFEIAYTEFMINLSGYIKQNDFKSINKKIDKLVNIVSGKLIKSIDEELLMENEKNK